MTITTKQPTPAPTAPCQWTPPPGRVGNLTKAQETALAKLRSELEADGSFNSARHDDTCLLRFLRARSFDVAKARQKLIEAEKWRKDFGVEELVRNFEYPELPIVDKYYQQYYHGHDKSGRPVYIECIGNLNVKALYECTSQQRLLQRLVVEYESFLTSRLPACSAAVGHDVDTSLTILDLGGVSLTNFVRVKDYVRAATSIGQAYYPEVLGSFIILNAPFMFRSIWSVIKGWLDPVTAAKVHILGGPNEYRPKLLELIDVHMLPKQYGGTCSCEGGCSLSDVGPWNPRGGECALGEKADTVLIEAVAGKVVSA